MYKYKLFSLISSLVFMNSCSVLDDGAVAPGYVEALSAIKKILFTTTNDSLTPELIQNIPYASAKLSIGRGSEGLVILESIRNKKETWVSADGVFIVIRDGRIVQTAGLQNNLRDIFLDYKASEYLKHESIDFISYYNFINPSLNNLKVEVSVKKIGFRKVELYDGSRELLLYEEYLENKKIGWKETNQFFYDDDGFIVKSIQSISPKLPKIYIEVTKKPAI